MAVSIDDNQVRSAKLDPRHCVRVPFKPRYNLGGVGGGGLLPKFYERLFFPFTGLCVPENPSGKYADFCLGKLQRNRQVSGLSFGPGRRWGVHGLLQPRPARLERYGRAAERHQQRQATVVAILIVTITTITSTTP
jgi:hypothetical protein